MLARHRSCHTLAREVQKAAGDTDRELKERKHSEEHEQHLTSNVLVSISSLEGKFPGAQILRGLQSSSVQKLGDSQAWTSVCCVLQAALW